jgi:hypothetical protein
MSVYRFATAAALIVATMGPGIAHAACTQQDATAKAGQLSQLLQAKMASDPAQGQALMAKMQPIVQSYQGSMSSGGTFDWDKVCSEYDALIKQAQ